MASGLDLRKKALSGTAFTENAAEKKSSSSSSWDSSSKKSYGGASEKKWSPSVTAPSAVVQAAKSSGTNLKDVSTAAKTDKSVTPSTVSRAVSKKVFGTAAPITPTGALAASKKVFTPSTVSKPFLSVTKDIRKDITTLHSRIQEEANNYKKSPFKDVNTYLTDIKNKSGEGH